MAYHPRGSWNSFASEAENNKHGVNINVYNFQAAVRKLLNKQEQKDITNILQCYNRNRNAYYLAESIKPLLNTSEKKSIVLLLRQIIPKTDRPTFDQFTCEETYQSKSYHSRRSSMSHHYTNDSGIGLNNSEQDFTSKASDFGSYNQGRQHAPRRSSSLSDLSGKRNGSKNAKMFVGTFGSAVRRKVRAVLARRGSSSNIELKSSMHRKYSSETKLNKLGQPKDVKNMNPPSNNVTKRKKTPTDSSSRDLVCINLRRGSSTEFGFTIGGGSEVGSGIFVTDVETGSPAESAGLSKGDVIIKVNEMQFNAGVSHDTAAAVLSTLDSLVMLVKPFSAPECDGCEVPWVDVNGRPSSPPHTISKKSHFPKPVLDSRRSSVHLLQAGERKVNLTVKPRQSLGLMIRGGSEYGLGIYVTGVDRSSAADSAGLRVGDEILEVNNLRLEGATHAEAVKIIKSSPMLIMIVRYIGKVPQNQSFIKDDRVSLHSGSHRKQNQGIIKETRNGVRATFQRKVINDKQMILPNKSPVRQSAMKVSSTMSTLEDVLLASPVWMLLNDHERRSVRYYVKEYACENINTNELVLALAELLNTSEKLTLMTSIRECIEPRDLDRFDVLLLRKEVESLRTTQSFQTSRNGSFGSLDASSQPSEEHSSFISASDAEVQTSTPLLVDSGTNLQESTEKPSVSPVRPNSRPPPPPPSKQPPMKPKRSSSLTRHGVLDSVSSSATEEDSPNTKQPWSKDDLFQRPSSPFSIAIENHRSSHSGRVKVGNKTSHPPLPSSEFFRDPEKQEEAPKKEPVYSSIIKPVKNPASELMKARRSSWKVSSKREIPDPPNNNASVSSTASVSSSSSVGEPQHAVPHPPPQKITFRSAAFASTVNSKASHSSKQPVQVDVHREPSVKRIVQKYSHQAKTAGATSARVLEKQKSFTLDDSSDDDETVTSPCLRGDVETQKVVVFRRANALGLVVEGGAGTKQPLPRVLQIQDGSCAQLCGRIRPGHVIHEVNGKSLAGLDHHSAVRAIALAFKQENRDSIEFVLSGPY